MATAPINPPTAIMQLAAMCQKASDENESIDCAALRERDPCAQLWMRGTAQERFKLEQTLRTAMLSTAPTSLADALVLAINLSSHVPDVGTEVSYSAEQWEPIVTALQNICIAVADAQPAVELTANDADTLALWRQRASWRSLYAQSEG